MLISIRKKISLKIIEDKACLFADCWSSCKFAEAKQNNAWNHIKHWCITWRGTPSINSFSRSLESQMFLYMHRYINISTQQIANAEFINLTKTHSSMKSAHRPGESWLVAPERRWSPATHTATSPSWWWSRHLPKGVAALGRVQFSTHAYLLITKCVCVRWVIFVDCGCNYLILDSVGLIWPISTNRKAESHGESWSTSKFAGLERIPSWY